MEKFDAIIIGAGIAGLSSALTAVRSGMRTALVEKENYLGGIAQDCFHTHICGLFKNEDTHPFTIANPGICSDVFKFLFDRYGDKCLVKMGKVETLAFVPKDLWQYFYQRLNQDKFSFFEKSRCSNLAAENKKIQSITIAGPGKKIHLSASFFIDASGGGDLSDNISKDHHADTSDQLGGYCILLKGESSKDLSLSVPYTAYKIVQKYKLDAYLKFVTITYNFLTKMHTLKFSVNGQKDMDKCQFIYQKLNQEIKELSKLSYVKSSEKIYFRTNHLLHDIDTSVLNSDIDCVVKSFWPKEKWYAFTGVNE